MGGDRPRSAATASSSESRPPRRDYAPRSEAGAGESRPPRRTFSKPGTFDRKREGFAGKSFSRDGDSRPPRRDFGDSRPPRRDYAILVPKPVRDSARRVATLAHARRVGENSDSRSATPRLR